ncbi:hypothetical protein ZWY2020_005705 [Hordeum vulgare]|nr:hypothetical protein ZWY2020_005705 [Hordeum vulgare]
MTKGRRGRYTIDNSQWGPEADLIESGYRVPFGKIHILIGKIGASVPEPDTFTNIVEPPRCAHPAKHWVRKHHAFIGFTQGTGLPDEPVIQEITTVNESAISDTDSIYPLLEGQLGGFPEAVISEDVEGPHRQVTIYMAGAAPPQPNAAGNNEASGSGKTPAQAMADLVAEIAKLMAITVMAENQEEVNAKLTKLREEMDKIERDME